MTKNNTSTIFVDVANSEVISFDVFDTLITRNFIEPRDVLYYLGLIIESKYGIPIQPEKFVSLRLLCERIVREESGKEDITLDEIYQSLGRKLFISEELTNKLKEEEMRAELKFCIPRPEIKKIYEYAVNLNKKIFFVSDMYLERDFIIKLLLKNGYLEASEENVLVSSFYGKTKHTGSLFQVLKENAGTKNILHIGDNFFADTKKARESGIKAYYCENCHNELMKNPEVAKIFYQYKNSPERHLALSLMLALVAHKFLGAIHPSRVYSSKSLFNGKAYNFGYFGVGIFLLQFNFWLHDFALKNGIKEIQFLARDGDLIKQVFDLLINHLQSNVRSNYLISSRRMYSLPSIESKADINLVFNNNYTGTVKKFIEVRLGLSCDDNEVLKGLMKLGLSPETVLDSRGADALKLRDLLDVLSPQILQQAKLEREALLEYFKSCKFGAKPALVDLGYNGSIAAYFQKLTKKQVFCLNILADASCQERTEIPSQIEVIGWVNNQIPFVTNNFNLRSVIPMLESVFSSTQNQAVNCVIDGDSCKVSYIEEAANPKRMVFVNELREGVNDFVNDFLCVAAENLEFFKLNSIDAARVLTQHFNFPAMQDLAIWDGVYFENNFAGWENKAIFSSSGQYESLWGIRLDENQKVVTTKKITTSLSSPTPETFVERCIYVLQGPKKFLKFHENPERFYGDSRGLSEKIIGKIVLASLKHQRKNQFNK